MFLNIYLFLKNKKRVNKKNVYACFRLKQEVLSFRVRPELGEIYYKDNHVDLDRRLCDILR